MEFHTLGVTDIAFSHNDQFIVSASRDRSWALFALEDSLYKLKASSQAHTRIIFCCAWSPDDSQFMTGSRDKKLKIWNTDGEQIDSLSLALPVTACVYVTPTTVALGFEDGKVSIIDLKTKNEIGAFKHGSYVTKLKWKDRKSVV